MGNPGGNAFCCSRRLLIILLVASVGGLHDHLRVDGGVHVLQGSGADGDAEWTGQGRADDLATRLAQ